MSPLQMHRNYSYSIKIIVTCLFSHPIYNTKTKLKTKLNSVALVRERTIPTERPPPVGEVSANFLRIEGCHVVSATDPRPLISVFWTGAATFYSSSSSIDLTRLSGPRSRPTTTQKIW